MELTMLQMPRGQARQAFLEYRAAVRERHNEEDEQIMRGYRAIASGHQVMELSKAMARGGTVEFPWRTGQTRNVSVLPRLAVCRADSRFAYTNGVLRDGSLQIRSRDDIAFHNRRDRIRFGTGIFPEHELTQEWSDRDYDVRFRATVPIVPPPLRPGHALSNYHILWEAEWALYSPPAPRDPALLKHLGGDLYAVVAVWELTDIERAVLSQRGQ